MQINPVLIQKPQEEKQKTSLPSTLSLVKNALVSVLENKVLKVQMTNEKELNQTLATLLKTLEGMNGKAFQIGKATIDTQKVEGFNVSNLESITFENIENLGLALNQLTSILDSLKSTDKASQQTNALLGQVSKQIGQLVSGIRDVAAKKVEFPAVQKVQGEVSVSSMPESNQLERIAQGFERLQTVLSSMHNKPMKEKKTELAEGKMIMKGLSDIADKLSTLPDKMMFPTSISIDNFPPQKYPMPVTHMSINSLKGEVKSTAVTVTTSLTPLPGEVLAYRRSLVAYNNSGATTVYLGGSTMTASDGIPVPAGAYSPAFDAGPSMIIYARTASGTADVRVLEASDENSGR